MTNTARNSCRAARASDTPASLHRPKVGACCSLGVMVGLAWGVALLSGCVAHGNERNRVGGFAGAESYELASLSQTPRSETAPIAHDGPSLKGASKLSRADWALSTLVVPVDAIEGTRTYSRPVTWSDATARQRGDYPTAATAVELAEGSEQDQTLDAAMSGLLTMYEGVALLPRMLMVCPAEDVRHAPQPKWRAPVTTQRRSVRAAMAPDESACTCDACRAQGAATHGDQGAAPEAPAQASPTTGPTTGPATEPSAQPMPQPAPQPTPEQTDPNFIFTPRSHDDPAQPHPE